MTGIGADHGGRASRPCRRTRCTDRPLPTPGLTYFPIAQGPKSAHAHAGPLIRSPAPRPTALSPPPPCFRNNVAPRALQRPLPLRHLHLRHLPSLPLLAHFTLSWGFVFGRLRFLFQLGAGATPRPELQSHIDHCSIFRGF